MHEMIGKTFGRWTVLEETNHRKNGLLLYLCKCECGTVREVAGYNLKKGLSTSCGCLRRERAGLNNFEDLSGKTFDKLYIIGKSPNKTKTGHLLWECRCECGKICERTTTSLRKNRGHSCGCYEMERLNSLQCENLIGKKFRLLTVIDIDKNKIDSTKKRRYWICKCECGNTISVPTNSLTGGHTSSCGCLKTSIGEYQIESILKENNVKYKKEYSIKELNYKRFDVAIINEEEKVIRLIEFDGKQHYKITGGAWEKSASLEERQRKDKEKNQWATDHSIPLIRIPYWERDNITLEMIMGDQYLVKKE